jgi:hypothetical protein
MARTAKTLRAAGLAAILGNLGGLAGCVSGPVPPNPMAVQPGPEALAGENPLFVPQGPQGYSLVFDKTYDIVAEYFPIARSNRFDGTIETRPLITAGYFDGPRARFYDGYELLESSFQTVRRRAEVQITPADNGGYFIEVRVLKELEDLERPSHAGTGAAVFRTDVTVDRQYQIVEPFTGLKGWIDFGRDCALERVILERLKSCL